MCSKELNNNVVGGVKKMMVFLADSMPSAAVRNLESLGLKVMNEPAATAESLSEGISAQILVVRSTVVTRACIEKSPELSLIIRAGAGVNNIDLAAASELGIYVANCPGKNAIAVAELTLGLILSLDRQIPANVADFNAGVWNKGKYSKADGLYGKTLGVVGTGQIGQEVIIRAKSFGMSVVAWSRSLTEETAEEWEITRASSVAEVAACCDILSVHLALKPETRGIISAEVLSKLRDGGMFINTSRAEVVDETALLSELTSGRLKAGLDVFNNEPEGKKGEFASPLARLPNACITHHIGASTEQAQMAVADDVVDIIRGYVKGGHVRNWINRQRSVDSLWQLVVRHFDRPGVLANVMTELKEANINAQELENVIFDGKKAACCTVYLSARPSDEVLARIRSRTDQVISAVLVPRG